MTVKVDVGIACSKFQSNNWWQPVLSELLSVAQEGVAEIGKVHAVSSALPDHNKNLILDDRRFSKTDHNRNKIARGFLHGDSEWLWFLDDDTVPPENTLMHLLAMRRPFVAGLYHLARPPHNPLAYIRDEDGLYASLWEYEHGTIAEVDSVGMGCTLIHKKVFKAIMEQYVEFQRPDGSVFPVHRDDIDKSSLASNSSANGKKTRVRNMVLQMPLKHKDADDPRAFPFFAMEYGRTEDHFFCELADRVGYKPVVDTAIVCQHWREKPHDRKDFREYKERHPELQSVIDITRPTQGDK